MPSLSRAVRARPLVERLVVAAAVAAAGSAAVVIEANADDSADPSAATTVVTTPPEPSDPPAAVDLGEQYVRADLVPVDDARDAVVEGARAAVAATSAEADVDAAGNDADAAENDADAAGNDADAAEVDAGAGEADADAGGGDGTAVSEAVWDELAECESSGDWSINTGNGYYGGLQFNLESWQWAGGDRYSAYPHEATREQQIEIAERLLEIHPAGWGAWPACSAQLGLR